MEKQVTLFSYQITYLIDPLFGLDVLSCVDIDTGRESWQGLGELTKNNFIDYILQYEQG